MTSQEEEKTLPELDFWRAKEVSLCFFLLEVWDDVTCVTTRGEIPVTDRDGWGLLFRPLLLPPSSAARISNAGSRAELDIYGEEKYGHSKVYL